MNRRDEPEKEAWQHPKSRSRAKRQENGPSTTSECWREETRNQLRVGGEAQLLHPKISLIKSLVFSFIFKKLYALAGVAQWNECRPLNQGVAGLIPSQGTCLGCRPVPQLRACERQPIGVSLAHRCFSPYVSSSFPSLPLHINK